MNKKGTCEIYCYNEEKVNRIKGVLQKEDMSSLSNIFKLLADENRAKILYSLSLDEELCVCDIANIIGSSVATASHHLRALHKQDVVKYRKEKKLAFYSLNNDQIKSLISVGLQNNERVNSNV